MSSRVRHAGADQASPNGEQAPISERLPDLEQASAQEVLAYGVERFAPRLTMACSFQKEESVLFHMLSEITGGRDPIRAFTIDTGVLFPETLTTWKAFEDRFGVKLDVLDATSPGEPWTAERCCGEAKVRALELGLSDVDAWITGIRREQAPTRAAAPKFERDERRRDLQAQPARRLVREGPLALHLRARSPLPSAARPGVCVDRMRPVHAARCWPRGSLDRSGQDRVRHPSLGLV